LKDAAEDLRAGRDVDWETLVDWSKLPSIRADLDLLPDPRKSSQSSFPGLPDAGKPEARVFRFCLRMWKIQFGGESCLIPHLTGYFYLCELLKNPKRLISASSLKSAHAQWGSTSRTTGPRRGISAIKANSRTIDQVDGSADHLDSPVSDLGDQLDKEGQKSYLSAL
jgi:hypothetical protein